MAATREEIEHEGIGVDRMGFVLDAAMKIAAASEAAPESFATEHGQRAVHAFDAAEALWAEACRRFPEQEEEPECSTK